MNFRGHCRTAGLLGVLEALRHRLRVAGGDRKISVRHLVDDPTISDPDIVAVAVYPELTFRLRQKNRLRKARSRLARDKVVSGPLDTGYHSRTN